MEDLASDPRKGSLDLLHFWTPHKSKQFCAFISFYIFFRAVKLYLSQDWFFLRLCACGNLYTERTMTFNCIIFYIMKENILLGM